MKKLIIFNWKLNPQKYSEAEKIIKMFLDLLKKYRKRPPAGGAPGRAKKDELIICPPFIYLLSLSSLISHVSYLKLGSQDAFWKNDGAYTGEVSPEMLKNLGVEYTIIGHSERRQHLNETDEIINEKVKTALGAGLKVILCVGEPHRATSGKRQEPVELSSVEVPEEFTGTVIEMMGKRLGVMKDMRVDSKVARMDFEIPTRGLIGFRNEFLTATKGEGIINSLFLGYQDFRGELSGRNRGSLVAHEAGESNSYGLLNAQSRGRLFIGPGVPVYEGMVVGENAKEGDISVNICKAKELTNFRTKNFGVQEGLEVPRNLSLEEALEFIADDELVEVTPKNIRLRKASLKANDRRK